MGEKDVRENLRSKKREQLNKGMNETTRSIKGRQTIRATEKRKGLSWAAGNAQCVVGI